MHKYIAKFEKTFKKSSHDVVCTLFVFLLQDMKQLNCL